MSWVDGWWDAVVRASWQGAAVVALVWLICRAMPKLPPAWRCWAWRGACAKLVLSFAVAGAVAVPLLPAPRQVMNDVANFGVGELVSPAPMQTFEADIPVPAAAPSPPRSPLPLLFALWSTGFAACLARLALGHARAVRLLRRARPVTDADTFAAFHDLSGRMGVGRVPALTASNDVRSPLVAGVFRPTVVLPARHGPVEPERLRMMLAHELAHVRRRDLAWTWLPALAQSLLWFHPIAWLAARELRAAQEAACDALALSATGAAPARYGQMLLDAVAAARAPLRLPRTSLVTIVETRTTVERRLAAMTHYRTTPPTRRTRALGVLALACFCLVAVVPWKLVAQEQPAAGQRPAADPAAAHAADPFGLPGTPADPAEVPGTSAADPRGSPGAGDPTAQPDPLVSSGGVLGRGFVMAPQFTVSARVAGTVVEVTVRPGQRVKKGELIARVDDGAIKAELEAAEAKADVARLEVVKAAERGAALDEQIARSQLKAAQAQVGLVRHKLESAQVLAPADGVLADVGAKAGGNVREGAPLATLVAVDTLSFETSVGADVLARLKEGQKAKLRIDALAPVIFEAELTYISPRVEMNTGTVRVGLRIHDPKGIRPGMSGSVSILVEPGEAKTYREALERAR